MDPSRPNDSFEWMGMTASLLCVHRRTNLRVRHHVSAGQPAICQKAFAIPRNRNTPPQLTHSTAIDPIRNGVKFKEKKAKESGTPSNTHQFEAIACGDQESDSNSGHPSIHACVQFWTPMNSHVQTPLWGRLRGCPHLSRPHLSRICRIGGCPSLLLSLLLQLGCDRSRRGA